ncbi:hypothetical protein GCM10007857_77250 [Bradyrhizobium iriomotense]|uniref:Uncharacterized protein n=1 Tax=Bradyrhizobium iriomotense TaxID=441950 RepID=A0ABQ6BC79_9BRAD|nr:hypothetical protein GCM10007857_77250 [Bradyrhizobium iriomotense]
MSVQEGASLIPYVAMSKEFRPWKIDEAQLLPPSVQDYVPQDHVSLAPCLTAGLLRRAGGACGLEQKLASLVQMIPVNDGGASLAAAT